MFIFLFSYSCHNIFTIIIHQGAGNDTMTLCFLIGRSSPLVIEGCELHKFVRDPAHWLPGFQHAKPPRFARSAYARKIAGSSQGYLQPHAIRNPRIICTKSDSPLQLMESHYPPH